jgi:hypothetical protein
MRAARTGLVFLVAAVAAAGCIPLHHPQPTRVVVVLEGGKRAGPVGDEIQALLRDRYDVVSDRAYRKAARTLHARRVSEHTVSRVAAAIGADAVIVGQLDRTSRRRYRLYLQLREGASGEVRKVWKLRLRHPELGDDRRVELGDGLFARIDVMPRLPAADEPGEPVAGRGDRRSRRARRAEERERARAAAQRKADEQRRADEQRKRRATAARGKRVAKPADKVASADKQGAKKKAGPAEDDEPFEMVIQTDENGQVLDDERPPGM